MSHNGWNFLGQRFANQVGCEARPGGKVVGGLDGSQPGSEDRETSTAMEKSGQILVSALGVGTVRNALVWVWRKGCFGCGDGDRDSPKAITVKGAMDGGWFGVVDVDVTIFGDFNTIVFVKDSGVACLCIIAQSDKGFIDRSPMAS